MRRRGFLGAMLAAAASPAYVRSESLMGIFVPKTYHSGGIVGAFDSEWIELAMQRVIRYDVAQLESVVIGVGLINFVCIDKEGRRVQTRPEPYPAKIGSSRIVEFSLISGPANR